MADGGLDVVAWREFERDLAAFARDVHDALDEEIRAAGDDVAGEVRRRIVGSHGSGRMAGSVRVNRRGHALVTVTVDARDPRTGYRYPRRVHFDTSRKHSDFLYGAVDAKREAVSRRLGDAIDRAITKVANG